jgi:hypothetical protein
LQAYLPLYIFIAGVIFAIMVFVVVELVQWFIKTIRNERKAP